MTLLSDKTSIMFSVLAGIFAIAEIVNELKFIIIPYFEIVRTPILVAVVIFTIIIVAWERNKIVLNHFPYSLTVEDVGPYYGIAGEIDEMIGYPREEPLRVLIRRIGILGEHKLQQIIFETRPQYEVIDHGFSEIPISSVKQENKDNNLKHVVFDTNNTTMKEKQLVYGFLFSRPKSSGQGSVSQQDLYCKIIVKYSYKLFLFSIPAIVSIEIPSSIKYT